MSDSSLPRWPVLVGLVLVTVLSGTGAYYLYLTQQERELYSRFAAFLTPTAQDEYRELGLWSRLQLAKTTVGIVEELEETDWSFTIDELRGFDSESPEFAFALDLGPGSVRGCTFSTPPYSGTCNRGGSINATPWAPAQSIDAIFDVQLGPNPHVETRSRAHLALGTQGGYAVEAQARIDNADVSLQDARVLVPNPVTDGHQSVRIEDIALGTATFLRAREDYLFDISHPMPVLLEPMFDSSRLIMVRFAGAIEADLRDGKPGFRAEGQLIVMNHEVGHAAFEYFPDHHTSLWVPRLSLPLPVPGVCFDVRDALIEYDFEEERLRLGGGLEIETAESLACTSAGEEMGMITRTVVVTGLDEIRRTFNLPRTIHTRGHVVFDLDDSILCADATVNNVSLLHAALAGHDRDFYMWAPKDFRTKELDGGLWSTARLAKDMYSAVWSFPKSAPWSCWSGDDGPKTDLFATILPETNYSEVGSSY